VQLDAQVTVAGLVLSETIQLGGFSSGFSSGFNT
jgi:hypothetical protein